MKAFLKSAPIAPKKANIIAKMVRGMPVVDAQIALRRTNKKAARMVEKLIASAVANATHNDKQDKQLLVVKTLYVNQSIGMRRGMPKARGQTRPYRKFMTHITLELGIADLETKEQKKVEKKAAKAPKAPKASSKKSTPDTSSSAS
jgi:large subunit ribosomal protein L22